MQMQSQKRLRSIWRISSKGEGEENVFDKDSKACEFVLENVDEDSQENE